MLEFLATTTWTLIISADFPGQRVPDPREYLTAALDVGSNLQLELRQNPGIQKWLVEKVTDTLLQIWPIGEGRPLVSSFPERRMRLCAETLPEGPQSLASEFASADPVRRFRKARCLILHTQATMTTPASPASFASGAIAILTGRVDHFRRSKVTDSGYRAGKCSAQSRIRHSVSVCGVIAARRFERSRVVPANSPFIR